jgi:hypothetical protein
MRRFLLLALTLLLAACATSTATPYQPRGESGYGYSEQAIEANRLRLSFRGNSLTERDTVETYLLFRAAEVTVERGYDYFVTTQRATDRDSYLRRDPAYYYPSFRPTYWYHARRFGWRPYYDPMFADPFWNSPYAYQEITRYEAIAEITMMRGRKPASDADAYDAREVIENLAPHVQRPAPPPA